MRVMTRIAIFILLACVANVFAQETYFRINQAGFLPEDPKSITVFADRKLKELTFAVKDLRGRSVLKGRLVADTKPAWGEPFQHYYKADISNVKTQGRYFIEIRGGLRSPEFPVGAYPEYQADLLHFMRQQRCGYNPWFDAACHRMDGRSFFAPFVDETFVDVSGGWHDAGDQLKYLITSSNATARLLLAFEMERGKFGDIADELGREGRPNGIADILDEAKWGLDWIHKMHPRADQLFHQVADDRDHRGFKFPDKDNADYGWGENSYRPAYFADGKPQGLSEYKSRSTGVANIAGRSAAAMAVCYRIWTAEKLGEEYAAKCLQASRSLYAMGQRQEGFQQGNSFSAPYRYNEDTWADDMEWAAAELFQATQEPKFLDDAKRYAKIAGTTSWMEYPDDDMGELLSRHYEMYPFTNFGHYALFRVADDATKKQLAEYYRSGLEKIAERGKQNPYGVGVPFIWCSNNLVVAFITQAMLYEKMTGDTRFRRSAGDHRDWLFGRNPWGTSMFEGIPAGGEYPEDTHLPSVQLSKISVPGGLVDGPIAARTHKGLIGLTLARPDEFAKFQPRDLIYHDDVGDYATNEPTMDGTADAIYLMAALSRSADPEKPYRGNWRSSPPPNDAAFTKDHGAVTRGDRSSKQIALIFTGDEFAEGGTIIADALKKHSVKASFFFTGRFYRTRANRSIINRLKSDGHYLGAHSDRHLLYADWNDRSKTLVSRAEFDRDVVGNYSAMRPFGISRSDAPYFLPPYEWYNDEIAKWTGELGLRLVNFSPGTRSNADYTTDDDKNYISGEDIFRRIREYEAKDADGLNGFLLLSHIGSGPKRTDKFHDRMDVLLDWLIAKSYRPVRVDDLLRR